MYSSPIYPPKPVLSVGWLIIWILFFFPAAILQVLIYLGNVGNYNAEVQRINAQFYAPAPVVNNWSPPSA